MSVITLDTETTSLRYEDGTVVCLGVKIDNNKTEVYFEDIPKEIIAALETPNNLKVGHNVGFDVKLLRKRGINILGPYFDTKLAHFQLYPFESHALKDILTKMGHTVKTYKDIVGTGKKQITMGQVDRDIIAEYCSQDVEGTYNLYTRLKDKVNEWTKNIEFELINCIVDMETKGLWLNKSEISKIEQDYLREIGETKLKFPTLNLNSPKQIREFLISSGYSKDLSKYVTNGGQISTNKSTLNHIIKRVPICKDILRYRELSTLVKTFLSKMSGKETLIGNFNQVGAKTGRLSSSKPNLQNIPSRTADGRKIRSCIIPRLNHKFIVGDLNQIEPRLLAFFSKDEKLLEIFNTGGDFHSAVSREIFNKTEVDKNERFIGKTVGLATLYGASSGELLDVLVSFGVDVKYARVQEIRDSVLKSFPRARDWVKNEVFKAKKLKYISTIGGRRLPIVDSYKIVNYKIQGSASDIMKLILFNLYCMSFTILSSIHDEVIVEIKQEEIDKVHVVRHIMEKSFQLKNVPIKADCKILNSWGEK